MQEALNAIRDFVELGKKQRRTALTAQEKLQFETLDGIVRDFIEGARPAPRTIAAPTADTSTPPSGMSAPLTDGLELDDDTDPGAAVPVPVPQAPAPAPKKKKALNLHDLVDNMPSAERSKLGDITLDGIAPTGYTPPARRAFLGDYYSEGLTPAADADAEIRSVVTAGSGTTADLDEHVRVLFGLADSEAQATRGGRRSATSRAASTAGAERIARGSSGVRRAGSVASSPPVSASQPAPAEAAPAPAQPAQSKGIPVIVHLMAGGTARGRMRSFDPMADAATVHIKAEPAPRVIPMADILVIFFGGALDGGTTPVSGTALAVRLVNDRQITGRSPDYQEGAESLRLVPEARRGNIDHIWVPAWAVKGVELR